MRGFLGLTGYYRHFVKNYGTIAKPLTRLLQKNQFGWSKEAQSAFVKLKQVVASTPVLAWPNFSQPSEIETNASDVGVGAVLMQTGQPIAFIIKTLGVAHKHISIYEEFFALIMTIERWRQYLQRQEFVIKTDHKSLAYLLEQNLHSELPRKAMTRLMGMQFKLVYKKGKDSVAADALSRVGYMLALQDVSSVKPLWVQEITNSYITDSRA